MTKAHIIGIVLALLLVIACGQQIQLAEPIDESPDPLLEITNMTNATTLDPCTNITCGKGQVCTKGVCGCQSGTKSCNNECIDSKSCCTNKDCESTDTCEEGVCRFSCENARCPSNKICDEDYNGCTCPTNYRFCDAQNKCIPTNNCCSALECGGSNEKRCIPTTSAAKICITGSTKSCKFFDEGRSKPIDVDNQIFDILITKLNYTNRAEVLVNKDKHSMAPNERINLGGKLVLQLDPIKENGGSCIYRDDSIL